MDLSVAIQLITLIILLILSAFFASAETALTTINKIRIRALADDGNKKAQTLLAVTENSGKMLSAILIGNNVTNIFASSLATAVAFRLGGYTIGIVVAIMTLVILVFGEIIPKTSATIKAEKLSLRYAPFIFLYIKLMTPLIFLISNLSLGILLLFRIDPNAKSDTMTEDELRTIVDVSLEDGVIESEEKEMIVNVVDLGDSKAKDVMVPRVHVTFADVNSTYEELIEIFRRDKFTRLPVYEDNTDNIIGTINMKDLLLFQDAEDFAVKNILREAYFTYEYKNISELLAEMRKSSLNIAMVLDEYGESAGIITLEDILEEIVGEIQDEYDDHEEEFFKQLDDREYIVEGSMNLDDLNDRLNLSFEAKDYDSLGGFIIEHLDRLAEEGDEVMTDNQVRLVVEKLDKNRVERVHIYLPEPDAIAQEKEEELLAYEEDE